MKCHAGIDIGSTNIKLLVLDQEGNVCLTESQRTPYLTENSRKYFDLTRVDAIVDSMVEHAKTSGDLVSVGFSSVGESVVPVKAGKAIGNPVYWGEITVTSTPDEKEIAKRLSGFRKTGIIANNIMSLDKILWLRRNTQERPDYYLPFTTYEIYRHTGCIAWNYSQASRSNAYLVSEKAWNTELLEAFGLEAPGELGPFGMNCGEKDGIVYGLGGHDHITGIYGLYCATGDPSFIFHSWGTSATINLLTERELTPDQVYNPLVGGLVNGFKDGQYIVLRGLCSCGVMPGFWMKHFGYEPTAENYEAVNSLILDNREAPLCFTARIGENYYHRKGLPRGIAEYFGMNHAASVDRFIESSYAYNVMKTLQITADLRKYCDFDNIPYFCGGGAASNNLLMDMVATALGHGVVIPDISEICGLGAVCTGIEASGSTQVFEVLQQRLRESVRHEPDACYQDLVKKAKATYKGKRY